jgi:polysaccharide pyruvyl transferase WcaK-like protein
MKAVFNGYYGMQNAGDDAFLEVAAWGARKYWGTTDTLFFSPELPQLQQPARSLNAFAGYGSFARALYEIAGADRFVSAGGSTFHSPLHKTDLRTYAAWKKRLRLPGQTGAIGISLGPYTSAEGERSIVRYLRSLDFLALRDQHSYELACSYQLPYAPVRAFDLAALLPDMLPAPVASRGVGPAEAASVRDYPVVGVSLCHYERYTGGDPRKEARRLDFVLRLLSQLRQRPGLRFRFFLFNGHPHMGDAAATQEVISALEAAGPLDYELVPYLANVAQTYAAIGDCDLLLSTRLHASIFACYARVPFFLIEYHRKCSDFLEDVGQAAAYRLQDAERDPLAVAAEMEALLSRAPYFPPAHWEDTRARALLNFTATAG